MSLLSKVGRRSFKMRVIISVIYSVLIVGAVTMVYPFMVTFTGALSNKWEYSRRDMVPHFVFNGHERYMKFLVEKYLLRSFTHFSASHKPPGRWGDFMDIRADSTRTPSCTLPK